MPPSACSYLTAVVWKAPLNCPCVLATLLLLSCGALEKSSGGSGTGGAGGATSSGADAQSVLSTANTGAGGNVSVVPSVLVFSRTLGYEHASIVAGKQALATLAAGEDWPLETSDDANRFSDVGLAPFNVVVFLNTTGDVLDDAQQSAFERFIQAGRGYVGVHAAADTEYDWAWYGSLIGTYFRAHPEVQPASLVVEDTSHPATRHLPSPWMLNDEWYGFVVNPRRSVNVLLALDEQSYAPGESQMNGDHPIAWYHTYDGGRAFYTGLGHTSESYANPDFVAHLKGAIEWASGAGQ